MYYFDRKALDDLRDRGGASAVHTSVLCDMAARYLDLREQVLIRDELEARGIDVPEWADQWEKEGGFCRWCCYFDENKADVAPDLLPDEPGPLWRAILD